MRFLTTRRRHPLAGIVVVLLGLVAIGGVYAAFRPAVAESSTASEQQLVAQGRRLFIVGCSTCHGLNAQGIKTKRGSNYGPPLVGVGAAAVDFQVGTGRMPAQQIGAQIPQKRPVYDSGEIRALAAYIASLGPGPAVPEPQYWDTSKATDAQVSRGGEFFRTNCTACHNFAGSGGALPSGRYAPNIRGLSGKYIYEAMLTGPQQMPKFPDTSLTPKDKYQIIAYVMALQKQPAYGGTQGGLLGPITEGLWAWIGGLGALVLVAVWIGNQGVRARRK